jgi:hypothetical protein
MARYLAGYHADNTEVHIIVEERKGERFAWCKPNARLTKVTAIGIALDAITCPKCLSSGIRHWIERNEA